MKPKKLFSITGQYDEVVVKKIQLNIITFVHIDGLSLFHFIRVIDSNMFV